MQHLLHSKPLLVLCFSALVALGMLSRTAVAEPVMSPSTIAATVQNPVPVKAPGDDQSYKMTNSDGKEYPFDITFIDKNGNVGGFWSKAHDLDNQWYLYVLNPDTKEYGDIHWPYPWSWLEFFDNPYGPGYTWHRVNSNGTVIEQGELRLQ